MKKVEKVETGPITWDYVDKGMLGGFVKSVESPPPSEEKSGADNVPKVETKNVPGADGPKF